MLGEVKQLSSQLATLQATETLSPDQLLEQAEQIHGTTAVVAELPGANAGRMRTVIDQLRRKVCPIAVLLASAQGEDKVILVAGISDELEPAGLHAGHWVRDVAKIVDGSGGGKSSMAQAGGKSPDKLPEALDEARRILQTKLATA
jgi:alanyl-tRNA synthetase